MGYWIYIILILGCSNFVEGLTFMVHPRRLQLHGDGEKPILSLVCHFNNSDDVTRIYEIEIGRKVKDRAIPIARLTNSGASVVDVWSIHRLNVSGEITTTELGLSFLDVKMRELKCPDVTQYYCLAYYGTSGKIGVLSDEVKEVVKATGVTIVTTTDTTTENQQHIISVNCTFLYPGTSLYKIQIGTKTSTSRSLLVAANKTGIHSLSTNTQISKMDHSFSTHPDEESWAAMTLLQESCDVTYFCKAMYVSGNVTETDEDSKEIRRSCRTNVSRHKNSVTNAERPRDRDLQTTTQGYSNADRRRIDFHIVLTILTVQQLLIGNLY